MLEQRKQHNALFIALSILLACVLALLCWFATGPRSLTPSSFRWGFYPLYPHERVTGLGPEVFMAGDAIITDRNAEAKDAVVVYIHNGRKEVVLWRVYSVGTFIAFLEKNAWYVWGISAAAVVLCAVLWITAPKRRIHRMQEQMKKTFAVFGARFDKEEEEEY